MTGLAIDCRNRSLLRVTANDTTPILPEHWLPRSKLELITIRATRDKIHKGLAIDMHLEL